MRFSNLKRLLKVKKKTLENKIKKIMIKILRKFNNKCRHRYRDCKKRLKIKIVIFKSYKML